VVSHVRYNSEWFLMLNFLSNFHDTSDDDSTNFRNYYTCKEINFHLLDKHFHIRKSPISTQTLISSQSQRESNELNNLLLQKLEYHFT